MAIIMPIKELRDTTKISEACHNTSEPIYITKNGYGDMVIMSISTFNSISLQNEIDCAISRFEKELADGVEFLDAEDALKALRRKHLG
jgi:PHD/YefM family antitoxin component YafN of YafNO toxin-antitoxin module